MPKPHEILEAIPGPARAAVDAAAGFTTLMAIVNALPSIAAGLSIAWLMWQMWDRYKYGPKALRSKQNGD
jgi:hypothetical protein